MSQISITGASTGTATFTIESPATSTNRTLTLPDNTGTIITQNSTPAFASTIGVGGATAAASGAGITFPATQSASSDANTLDDYEEGTFTPLFISSGGGTAAGYTAQDGIYTKIGRLIHAAMRVTLSDKTGLNAGNVSVGGLPFAANSTNVGRLGITVASINNISSYALGDSAATFLTAGGTSISLRNNSGTIVTVANLANNSQVDIQITYQT